MSTWSNVMSAAMSLPGIEVDRDSFLRDELKYYCKPADLARAVESLLSVLSLGQLDRIAHSVINNHTLGVTLTSAAAGIPGGLALFGTIPGDIAQYYWHLLVTAQKLAYLYGLPSLTGKDGTLTETATDMLTLFMGVMLGCSAASKAITSLTKKIAVNVVKKLPQEALTKGLIYPIVKQVAKYIGVKITKDIYAKGIGKVIPLIGGVISGAFTYCAFKPSAERLLTKLREQAGEIQSSCRAAHFGGAGAAYIVAVYD